MSTTARTEEIWILGATGRTGRGVASQLIEKGFTPVLVGRHEQRLRDIASRFEPAVPPIRVIESATTMEIAAEITRARPAIVVNTIGAYTETATTLATACLPGGHYVDLAADPAALSRLFELDQAARDADSAVLTGVGFGVLATEAPVWKLCADNPSPNRVRVDALASVATEPGVLGSALAASILDALITGAERYENGRLVPTQLGAEPRELTLPDGTKAVTATMPSGELLAAERASQAPNVSATSALAPTSPVVRAILPVARGLLSITALQRLTMRLLAQIPTKANARPRAHSWGHAVAHWPDGSSREAWLRAGEGMEFTTSVVATVVAALARGEGHRGASTPAALFGPEIAIQAGAEFILD